MDGGTQHGHKGGRGKYVEPLDKSKEENTPLERNVSYSCWSCLQLMATHLPLTWQGPHANTHTIKMDGIPVLWYILDHLDCNLSAS